VPIARELVHDLAAWAGAWLGRRQRSLRIPGLQFAIAHEGEIVRSGAHGVADLASGEALRGDHRFHVASHSKTFTATVILQLAERDPPSLRLDDPLGMYLPSGRSGLARLARLTVTDLLHHGSGLVRDGCDGDYWQLQRPFPDAEELLDLIEASDSPYPANERFHYSNMAYSLLGLVIAAATGGSYSDCVRREIIEPLGLKETAPDYSDGPGSGAHATGHTRACEGRERAPVDHVATHAMAPAAGFTSTASDLCRYFSAHCFGDERLLSDASKRRMQHPWWAPRPQEHYGLGLQMLDIGERRLIGHSGGYPGHTTRTWCDPRDRVVVSVLCNASDADATRLVTGIFRLLDHLARDGRPEPHHGSDLDLESFTGHFASLEDSFDIVTFGRRLLVVPTTEDDPTEVLGELVAEGADRARLVRARDGYVSEGELFTFARDGAGRVTAVRGFSAMSAYPAAEYAQRYIAPGRVVAAPGRGERR
jgi:D-alanyl-D-alanine carboxypeptidase